MTTCVTCGHEYFTHRKQKYHVLVTGKDKVHYLKKFMFGRIVNQK